MTLELSRQSANDTSTVFAPGGNLLGVVQRILSARINTRIVLPATREEIAVFPERGEYYANVADMAAFCNAPAAQFDEIAFDDTALAYASGPGRHIGDLLWQVAFHASQGRLIEDCSKYDVVQFRHWPNLTRLPVTPNSARICALLTRHPTTIMLIHRMLGIDKEEVYQNYSAAHSAGLVNAISRNPDPARAEAELAAAMPEAPKERSLFRSLFAKISGL